MSIEEYWGIDDDFQWFSCQDDQWLPQGLKVLYTIMSKDRNYYFVAKGE